MGTEGARSATVTDPLVSIDTGALLAVISRQCGANGITNNAQLSAAILALGDAATATIVRQLLAVCVRVGPAGP